MKKIIPVVIFSMILIGCKQDSQPIDKDKAQLDKVCDLFMQLFKDGQPHNALELLKKNTILSSGTIDTLQTTIDEQINNYFISYGKMLSYEFVTERKIKDFLSRRFYILRFDNYYLKFEFTIYKTANGWKLTGLNYNGEIAELLED